MGKWIKKVSTVKLDERAKVIDSLEGNQVKHAPSIHVVKTELDKTYNTDNLQFELNGTTLNITTS